MPQLKTRALTLMRRYLWPRDDRAIRVRVVAAFGILLAGRGLGLWLPLIYAGIVARFAHGLRDAPIALIVGYGALHGLSSLLGALQDAVLLPATQRITRRVTQDCVRHVHGLPLKFHLERQTGALTRVVDRGADALGRIFSIVMLHIGPATLGTALTIGMVARVFGGWYALTLACSIAAYGTLTLVIARSRVDLRRARNTASNAAQHRVVDSLLNAELVRAFSTRDFETARIDAAQGELERASLRVQRSATLLYAGQGTIVAVTAVVIMILAALDVAAGRMDVGRFVLINTYVLALYDALYSLAWVYATLRAAWVDLENLLDLLFARSDIESGASSLDLTQALDVRFAGVCFGYGAEREVLHDLSFSVAAGRSIAIVGATGAGKSTIGRLLQRGYDPQAGRVYIGGQDVRELTAEAIAGAIGVVPQETALFNDTIGFNIAYGRIGATQAEIEAAAKAAQLHAFVMSLADGYDTLVGERGLKLSGGERQRIAIARVVLKDPPIVLLDEATSALDSHTEQAIVAAMRALARNRTTISIAHRLSTIRDSDAILVLEGGKLAEYGAHPDLMAAGGLYAGLWAAQEADLS